jgi:hypothetical protein
MDIKTLGKALITGGLAVYAAEYVEGMDTYKNATSTLQPVYKYGAALAGALVGHHIGNAIF